MPEFWTLCDNKSKAVLIQLHWEEHNCFPDFYYELKNPKPIKPVINAPDFKELETMETERIMQEPPRKIGRGGY
uniref:Uncharacterized protein n=1 Tax=viral metagenome TaxID=1070528 RepID=A0A6M3JGK5_9ZZZZ